VTLECDALCEELDACERICLGLEQETNNRQKALKKHS
jgi:hypothetical protein